MKNTTRIFGAVCFLSAMFFVCFLAEAQRSPHRPTGKEPKSAPPAVNDVTSFYAMGPLTYDNRLGVFHGQIEDDPVQFALVGPTTCFDACENVPQAARYPEFNGASYYKNLELLPENSFWLNPSPECLFEYSFIKDPSLGAVEYGCVMNEEKGLRLLVESFSGGEGLHNYFSRWFGTEHMSSPYGAVSGGKWMPRYVSGGMELFWYYIKENRLKCPRRATKESPVSLDELVLHGSGAPLPPGANSEWGDSTLMLFYDVSTPELRAKAVYEMKRTNLVPPRMTNEDVIPREWYEDFVEFAGMPPDSRLHLYVKKDHLGLYSTETYWFGRIQHPDDSMQMFALGTVRFGQLWKDEFKKKADWQHGQIITMKEVWVEDDVNLPRILPPRLCE